MYKILLVDDEILIREKIRQKIPREELGFELVAACENGQEAMCILEKEFVDVVLTDICMPYVDGLELARYIHERTPETRVVILSGYAEFEYAKQAMQYQVSSYLLKPITSEELMDMLRKQKESLDNWRQSKEIQAHYLEHYDIYRSQQLMRLVLGFDTEYTCERLQQYGGGFYKEHSVSCAAILCPSISLSDYQKDGLENKIQGYSSKLLVFRTMDNEFVLFGREENNVRLRELLTNVKEGANVYIRKQCKAEINFLVGMPVSDYEELHFSYGKALELKEFLYLDREDQIYFWEDYNKKKHEMDFLDFGKDCKQDLLMAVQSSLTEEIKGYVCQVMKGAREKWSRKVRVISIYQTMLVFVLGAFERFGIEGDALLQKEQGALEKLYQCSHIREMVQVTEEFLLYASEIYKENRESYGARQAALATAYIEQHFDDCELSVANICEKLSISISYFSSAFKIYTGKTFIETLTNRRMEEAKLLLRSTDLKIYEVAERCGYREPGYFIRSFKKCVHMTPKEYAKKMRQ